MTVAAQAPTEADVKAAYLFNFGKFVRYPTTDAAQQFSICVMGHEEIESLLEQVVARESLNGRPVRARQIERIADGRSCSIVFLGASEGGRLDRDLEALRGSSALTVGDAPQFLERGGMIQFLLQNNRVRFSVNLPAALQANLSLSSELLKVAVHVIPASPGAGA